MLAHADECRGAATSSTGAEEALEDGAGAARGGARGARRPGGRAARRAREAAPRLAEAVRDRLAELAMEGAAFEVALAPRDGPRPHRRRRGRVPDRAEPRRARRPAARDRVGRRALARDARADERGRREAGAATLVFDEVDAGIGGQTARAVGEQLRALAEGRQVICITHLPQIASLADRHFRS